MLSFPMQSRRGRYKPGGLPRINCGSIDALGNLIVTLAPGDTALLNAADQIEKRSLIIDWSYGTGRAGRHQLDFQIRQLTA